MAPPFSTPERKCVQVAESPPGQKNTNAFNKVFQTIPYDDTPKKSSEIGLRARKTLQQEASPKRYSLGGKRYFKRRILKTKEDIREKKDIYHTEQQII